MLSNDELNIFPSDSLTIPGLVNNNDNKFNYPQPFFSSAETFTVLPLKAETLRFSSEITDDNEVNTINGTPGRDNLVGTEGDDLIIGSQGQDTITGGDGNDTFVYTSTRHRSDIITDFEVGKDKIDFTEVLDALGFTGDDPIESGYLGFETNETDVIVTIDPDGPDGRARAVPFLTLQDVADEAINNENFLASVLGLTSSETDAPIITVELANDTGVDDTDKITSDPTITGTITTENEIVNLTAGFNDTLPEEFIDITDALNEDGTFELDQELLAEIFGDNLPEGTNIIKLQATDSNGNLSEIIEFEFTLEIEPLNISIELANDTGADDADKITSDPTIIGTINTETEVVSLTAGFNDTPTEDFVDVTAALNEDGTFELDQELLAEIFGDTLTNGTYTLKLQATDSNGNLSEIIELEFILDLEIEPLNISVELANDTGVDDTDKITADPTIIGTINTESEIFSLTAGFNDTDPEEFLDITDILNEDGTFELDPELLEYIYGDTLTNGNYTLKLQVIDFDDNSSSIVEFEFTLDSEASEISIELANDTGADDTDNITSDPTIIGSIITESEIVNLKAGFNDTPPEEFIDVTAALNEDGTFELDQELLADVLGETLTDGTYFLNIQGTDSDNIASEIVEIEFTLDTTAPEIFVELANDTGDSYTDGITSDTTIIGTISEASQIVSFTGNLNNNSTEEFIDLTSALEIDGSLELTPELLENILGEEFIDGTYTLYLQAVDEHDFASDIIEFEFTFSEIDLPGPEVLSLAQIYGLDTYPDAITLPNTGTRQLSVKVDGWVDSPELAFDIGDISYSVADENILEISDEGLITATGVGETTITIEYGEVSATIPVLVDEPETGAAIVDENGGIVEGSDGSLVMLAPGALTEETLVNLTPLQQQDLSLPVPEGFEFATAFNLEIEDNKLDIPAQLAIPAPEGLETGTEVWFLRKGALPDETGTWNDIWLQEESGVVDADGFIRTTSPPYPGILWPGEYMVVYSDGTFSPTLVSGALSLNYSTPLAFLGIVDPFLGIGQLLAPDAFITQPAFTVFHDISTVDVVAVPQEGLPVVTSVGVELAADGLATFETSLNLLAPESDPTEAPVLQGAELKFNDDNGEPFADNEPVLFLTADNALIDSDDLLTDKGSRFEDLVAEFSVGQEVYEGTIIPELSQQLDENRVEVAFKVPKTVTLGNSQIQITRKQERLVEVNQTEPIYEEVEYQSNKLELENDTEYVFATMAFADDVAVIDASAPETVVNDTGSGDLLKAVIPVGGNSYDRPETLAVTSDNSRVYVPLKFTGGVAVVDPMVLSQVDNVPETPDVAEPIPLPTGARPVDIALDLQNDYAYIADENQPSVYVLDIDPFSPSYHQVVQTIELDAATGLNRLAINSESRRLFVTGKDDYIYVINIAPKDRPRESESNERKWHEQIGRFETEQGAFGLSATKEAGMMTFTNGNQELDFNGFGVLEITNDDSLSFEADIRYVPLTLGSPFDYFDVEQGYAVTLTKDADYAFVAGRNRLGNISGGSNEGGNIGIIKDPLGENPELVAATRPIKDAFTHDVVLSNDDKYLYVSNPSIFNSANQGDVYIYDVEEIIQTLENPPENVDFTSTPLDDINPNISIAASSGERAPIFLGFLPYGMAASPGDSDWLNLTGPTSTTEDLLPEFEWEFESPDEIEEISLFVSVFEENEGLLPWDNFVDFSGPNGNPFLSDQGLTKGEQIDLLSQPWEVSQYREEDDFNPNRILTVTWKKDEAGTGGTWYWGDGSEIYDTDATPISFELEEERTLTVGQTYYWGVEAYRQDGDTVDKTLKSASFELEPTLPEDDSNTFSSASIITHGFKPPLFDQPGVPEAFYEFGGNILDSQNGGLMMRYDRPTGYWVPVDEEGRIPGDFPAGMEPNAPGYKDALLDYLLEGDDELKDEYRQKPLVLLSDWSGDNESGIPDSGFSEAAADSIFSSLVQLDQWLGGSVGSLNPTAGLYDANGDLIRNQGALFNSPLHFIGFSRGTIVNSEMIQRLGTFFPNAGGTDADNRDLQMTTLDPHDFNQPSLDVVEVKLPLLPPIELDYSDFFEPKVQVWDQVTFADNYYQTVPDLEEPTFTPVGRDIPRLPETDEYGVPWPREGWRNGNQNPNAPLLGEPDVSVRLGANSDDNENYLSSRAGFTKETDSIKFGDIELFKGLGGVHGRVVSWYAGTSNLGWEDLEWEGSQKNVVFRRQGDPTSQELFDKEFYDEGLTPRFNPWYVPNHEGVLAEDELESLPTEGIGSGWFYSVLGGGKDLRPETDVNKVPVDFDNTDSERMRGDFAVPTLFNGNFDAVTRPNDLVRNVVSQQIPGWSFHGGGTSEGQPPTDKLVDLQHVPTLEQYLRNVGNDPNSPDYQTDYALKLEEGEMITHNRFVVPDWGALRFDVHVPIPARLNDRDDYIEVFLETDTATYTLRSEEINPDQVPENVPPDEDVNIEWPAVDLREVHHKAVSQPFIQSQLNRIGFGSQAFETFQVNVPDEARGKSATLRFQLQGDTEVYLDNVFFKSEHLKFGNPDLNQQEGRPDPINQPNNYLIERPQYALSYSDSLKTANWVSYKSDPSFLAGTFPPSRPPFREDFSLPFADKVISNDYSNVGSNNNTVVIRGHLVPNQDRALTTQSYHTKPNDETGVLEHYEIFKDNAQTYLMTNVVPQVPEDRVWQTLEGDLNEFVSDPSNARNEVYIIAGTLGSKDQIPSRIVSGRNPFNINVPEYLWKVVLIPEEPGQSPTDITYGASAFGVLMENVLQPQGENWKNSSVSIISSVNDIEDLTGLDFFSNIPKDIQEVIENYTDTSIIP